MRLKLTLCGTLLLIGSVVIAQDVSTIQNEPIDQRYIESVHELESHFTNDMSTYFSDFNQENWDGVIDMIYPKLFDLITKDQMIQLFSQIKEMGMDMNLELKKIDRISELINYENLRYCRVYYNGELTIGLSGDMLAGKDQLEQGFISAYGHENVKYDETNNRFDINAKKSMIAISSLDSDDWKYIEYNEQQEQMFHQLLPKEVLDKLLN